MIGLKPNDQRARIAIIFFIVIIILDAASFLSDYVEYGYMKKINAGLTLSDDKIELLEIVQGAFGLAYVLVFILVIIMFIRWFRRAYYNLALLVRTESTDGWAAGAWFIPFYNLYKPKQIMKELWDKTNRILKLDDSSYEPRDTTIIGFWWILWIVSNIGTNVSTRKYLRAETAEEFMESLSISMPMTILSMVAAVLVLLIIRKYSSMEQLLLTAQEKKEQHNTLSS